MFTGVLGSRLPPAVREGWGLRLGRGAGKGALVTALRDLGVRRGQTVLVHASLRRVGRIRNGVGTLLAALREVIGPEGTVVVPAFTSGNSDTSRAYHARVSGMTGDFLDRYRASMPAFDPDASSAIECGVLAEHVRTHPESVRSRHPQTSFAAIGRDAAWLMDDHALDCHLGELSPLAKLYKQEAQVLLLGVGFDKCSAFHLAEYRYVPSPPVMTYGCVITMGGRRVWRHYEDVVLDDGDFAQCGVAMERTVKVAKGRVGNAESRLFPLVDAVNFAASWLGGTRVR